MVKHYIRLNKDKDIIHNFCTDFEKPITGDICILENAPRHFHLEKGLKDSNGKWNYKYGTKKNSIVEKTEEEKWSQAELDEIEKNKLIVVETQKIIREQAIQKLKDDGKLDSKGNLIK